MPLDTDTKLSKTAVDAFLSRHETGVLSMAKRNEPYSIPISYGYDVESRGFYLRLVSTPQSEKREFLASDPSVRLVVSEESDPIYRSVIASGALTQIDRDELTVEHIEQYGDAKRPLFEIWGESRQDLEVQLYQLNPDEVSGREINVEREQNPS